MAITPVPNLKAVSPSTGATARREEKEDRKHSDRGQSDKRRPPSDRAEYSDARGRGRDRDRDRDRARARGRSSNDKDDLVDYIHSRDRLPRPTLKHRETSREGKRRHEYRYYDPQPQAPARPTRERPARPRSPERRRVQVGPGPGARARARAATTTTAGRSRDARNEPRSGADRRDIRRRASGGDDKHTTSTGKKRSAAQNLGKAAITAGAFEAVRQRGKGIDNTGAWKRVATAALGAAAIDAAAAKVRGRDPRDRGKRSTLGASLGGLVVEGLVHRMR